MMGKLTIELAGSFEKKGRREFSALDGGHAQAVAEAIAYLADEVLPSAIAQDHKLQEQGHYPSLGFGVDRSKVLSQ
jgi:hypothetical protein